MSNEANNTIDFKNINDLNEVELLKSKLNIHQSLLLERDLSSSDPDAILKAQVFLKKKNEKDQQKAFVFSPEMDMYNGNGFRAPIKPVSYLVLRKMARTTVPKIIINTRVDQVAGFANFTLNEQEKGWTIRKKDLFKKTKNKVENDKNIEQIAKFVMNCGFDNVKWDIDGFEEVLRAAARDSLELDQLCVESVYSLNNKIVNYVPVDAATIRLINDADNHEPPKNGYKTKYAQVWMDRIYNTFYPWEMSFGVRNKTTDIYANGYGISELEDMVQIVTYLLYGVKYNGNFFSQGSNPKGFFTIEGNLGTNAINEFKQMWRNTITGIENSHRVPVIEGGGKIQWIDMHHSNRDMEFGSWLDFLVTIACASFKIDPSECGFNVQKGNNMPFGQDGQKERLKHSQSKGLIPILNVIQKVWTRYIVEPLNSEYEFVFTGVEQEDQVATLDMDAKKVASGFMSMEEGFEKWSGRKFDPEKDTILNQVYQSIQQQKIMGGSMFGSPAGVEDEENDSTFQNPEEDNPFSKALLKYVSLMDERLNEEQ